MWIWCNLVIGAACPLRSVTIEPPHALEAVCEATARLPRDRAAGPTARKAMCALPRVCECENDGGSHDHHRLRAELQLGDLLRPRQM